MYRTFGDALCGLDRNTGIRRTNGGAFRRIGVAFALDTYVGIDDEHRSLGANSRNRAFRLTGAASGAKIGNNAVSHGILLSRDQRNHSPIHASMQIVTDSSFRKGGNGNSWSE